MADRELSISHAIGPAGRFRLTSPSGTVRIEGIDGDLSNVIGLRLPLVARLVGSFPIR